MSLSRHCPKAPRPTGTDIAGGGAEEDASLPAPFSSFCSFYTLTVTLPILTFKRAICCLLWVQRFLGRGAGGGRELSLWISEGLFCNAFIARLGCNANTCSKF